MAIWDHEPVVIPCDVQQVKAHADDRGAAGWELVAMVQIAVAGQPQLNGAGVLVQSQPQPAFLLVFKRPRPEAIPG